MTTEPAIEQPKENTVEKKPTIEKKEQPKNTKKPTQKEQPKNTKKPTQKEQQKQKMSPSQKKAQAGVKKNEFRLENIKTVEEAVQVLVHAARIDYGVPVYRLTDEQKKVYHAQQLAKQVSKSFEFDSEFRPYLVNTKRQVLGALAEQVSYMAALTDSMDFKFEQEKNRNKFEEAAIIMKLEQTVYDSIDNSTKSMLEAGKAAIQAGMGTRWQKKLYDEENKEKKEIESELNSKPEETDKISTVAKTATTTKATTKVADSKATAKKTV